MKTPVRYLNKFFRILVYFILFAISLAIIVASMQLLAVAFNSHAGTNQSSTIKLSAPIKIDNALLNLETESYPKLELEEIIGSFTLETTNRPIAFVTHLAVLLLSFLMWVFFRTILRILNTLKEGTPFIKENYIRIRTIGYIFIVAAFVWPVGEFAVNYYLHANVRITGINILKTFDFPWDDLLFGIAALILADVFRVGIEMKEDQNLIV